MSGFYGPGRGRLREFRTRYSMGMDHVREAATHATAGAYALAIESLRKAIFEFDQSSERDAVRCSAAAKGEIDRLTKLLPASEATK